ncbi:MAG: TIGR00730 family Rossman fold protein [Rhodospirillales bacterium]|nr:TIGR00730 family Rossman fold protein [Rhodospirillales bacterium]MCW8861444.1 TIGR00730 family Rossman fold protein [Rhodospirillales bacterium]MCW8951636.1 TIGR00730 family Rossman fold protein [Rhodospirillales bacterium]MCW9003444.1 TIGR00730 family Rossman fold protein [Rhodospirillales bacterium]
MKNIKALCVFCGSRAGTDPAHAEAAESLGRMMGERGIRLVYGGGGIGLMAVVANAAVAAGSDVVGVIPEFLRAYEVGVVDGAREVVVPSMHERKARMFEKGDGFVILPGGLGTLDEFIEITTWKQLQQHRKPIVLINVNGYWDPFLATIDRVVDGGYGHHKVRELFTVVEDVTGVFDALADAPEPDEIVLTSHL